MQQLSGTLLNLAVYLALVVLGAFLGSRPAIQSRPMPWLGRFQTAALLLLIVTLGAELGANDEIVSSLAAIGLNALIITLTSMVGSLLAVHILRKYLLELDAQGRSRSEAAREETAQEQGHVHVDHTLTVLIVASVVLGMLAGHFFLPDAVTAHCGAVINLGLYLLLFLVGLDMGRQGNMLQDIRAAGFRVFLVPLAAAVGTLALTALVGLFLPMGAILSNIMHELFSIVAVPAVAQRIGYIEAVALPGATAMDTVLPVVVSATSDRMALYSFTSGAVLSLSVPFLVPAIIALPF